MTPRPPPGLPWRSSTVDMADLDTKMLSLLANLSCVIPYTDHVSRKNASGAWTMFRWCTEPPCFALDAVLPS